MCRDNNHGGRRCPHDTSAARRIRRHRHEMVTMHGAALAPAAAPVAEVQPTYPVDQQASLQNIHSLREQIADLNAEYRRIRNDPFSVMPETPYEFEGGTYTDSVAAIDAINAAIEQRVIGVGDNIVGMAITQTGISEDAVISHITQQLTVLADEKDAIHAIPYTETEHAEIADLTERIAANETARKAFEHEHRNAYAMTGKKGLEARLTARLKLNPADNTALRLKGELARFKTDSDDLEKKLRDARNHHNPRVAEIEKTSSELLEREGQLPAAVAGVVRTHAQAYMTVLRQIRNFGGADASVETQSTRGAQELLAAALDHYPSEWIAASAAAGPMYVRGTTLRAHYQDLKQIDTKERELQVGFYSQPAGWQPPAEEAGMWQKLPVDQYGDAVYTYNTGRQRFDTADPGEEMWVRPQFETRTAPTKPKGNGWERDNRQVRGVDGDMQYRWRRPVYETIGGEIRNAAELTIDESPDGFDPRPGFSTALHEYAHRVEFKGPEMITRMEEQFLMRRSTVDGQREQLRRIYPDKQEFGYFDKFVNDYMGRVYEGSRSREILSMGMESIFAGSQGAFMGVGGSRQDPEMKRFILGLLATA